MRLLALFTKEPSSSSASPPFILYFISHLMFSFHGARRRFFFILAGPSRRGPRECWPFVYMWIHCREREKGRAIHQNRNGAQRTNNRNFRVWWRQIRKSIWISIMYTTVRWREPRSGVRRTLCARTKHGDKTANKYRVWMMVAATRSQRNKKGNNFLSFFFSASPFLLSSRNSWANLGLLCWSPSIERRRQVTGQTKIYKENTQRGEHNGRLPLSLKTSRVGILLTLCARGWWPRTYRNNTPVIIKDPFFPLSSSSSDYRYFSFSSRHGLIIQSADALWIFLCIYLLRSNR